MLLSDIRHPVGKVPYSANNTKEEKKQMDDERKAQWDEYKVGMKKRVKDRQQRLGEVECRLLDRSDTTATTRATGPCADS